MMGNYGCLGYAQLALQKMIDNNDIELETAEKVLRKMMVQFDFKTEKEAEEYYLNNSLEG